MERRDIMNHGSVRNLQNRNQINKVSVDYSRGSAGSQYRMDPDNNSRDSKKAVSPHKDYRHLRFLGNSAASHAAYKIYYGLEDV